MAQRSTDLRLRAAMAPPSPAVWDSFRRNGVSLRLDSLPPSLCGPARSDSPRGTLWGELTIVCEVGGATEAEN